MSMYMEYVYPNITLFSPDVHYITYHNAHLFRTYYSLYTYFLLGIYLLCNVFLYSSFFYVSCVSCTSYISFDSDFLRF